MPNQESRVSRWTLEEVMLVDREAVKFWQHVKLRNQAEAVPILHSRVDRNGGDTSHEL